MLLNLSVRGLILGVAGVLGIAAHAAPVGWSNSAGSFSQFSWSSGQNETALASASPNAVNGSFLFSTSNFKAVSLNGGTQSAGDIIRVTLIPATGKRIASISADFFGDASIAGTGSASISATLDVLKQGTSTHATGALNSTPITTQGSFNENLFLAVPEGFGTVELTFDTAIHTTAGESSSAFIEMKLLRFGVETADAPVMAVPLPAAVVSFVPGALVAAIAARRMNKR